MQLRLKSTGQPVHEVPYAVAGDRPPWPSGYTRVFRAFKLGEGAKSIFKGEHLIVQKSKLKKDEQDG